MGGGNDCVQCDFDVAIGAVLEADRRGQAGRQFAVDLRFGGAGADRPPTDQIPMYWGEMVSRNSEPAGTPNWWMRSSKSRAIRRPSLMRNVSSR